jgi:hypothetical protein
METKMKPILLAFLMALLNTQAIADTKYGENDSYKISSTKELTGPDGFNTTCRNIAVFFSDEYGFNNARTMLDDSSSIMYVQDGQNKKKIFKPDAHFFIVKFIDWTPAITEYLQSAIDSCVADRSVVANFYKSWVVMQGDTRRYESISFYPLKAKRLLAEISNTALASKKFYEDQAENQKRMELESQNRKIAYQEHIVKIRNGEEKIQNVSDAILYYSAKSLGSIAISPLLKPDNQYYSGLVIIDFQEKENLLRAKIENYVDIRGFHPIAYIFLSMDKKTISFNLELLRIGQKIGVVGRYIKNVSYITIAGEEKISPVMQVLYMDAQ